MRKRFQQIQVTIVNQQINNNQSTKHPPIVKTTSKITVNYFTNYYGFRMNHKAPHNNTSITKIFSGIHFTSL